jgi:hypothetical protein
MCGDKNKLEGKEKKTPFGRKSETKIRAKLRAFNKHKS